jgi:hypothetical protein
MVIKFCKNINDLEALSSDEEDFELMCHVYPYLIVKK